MAAQISGCTLSNRLSSSANKRNAHTEKTSPICSFRQSKAHKSLAIFGKRDLSSGDGVRCFHLPTKRRRFLSPPVTHCRNARFLVAQNHLSSDSSVSSYEVEERIKSEEELAIHDAGNGAYKLKEIQQQSLDLNRELWALSLPAIAGQAIEPLAQLMETAYIGRLGPVELASAGISMNIFNYISKLFNIPLLSIATSFVAEDISKNEMNPSSGSLEDFTNDRHSSYRIERKQLSSVSTALLLAVGIGLFEASALYFGSEIFLDVMGISSISSMRIPAKRFLSIRALGAPAVVLTLALQGVFRGFKDTKTPVYCLGIGNLLAVFLFPLLIYYFQLGTTGAAMTTVISQYVTAVLMIWFLNKRAVLLPPKMGALQFGGYIKSGGFLLGRTLSVLTTMTLATKMAASQGAVAMAAHQICIQVWLAVSLLTDALAASGQALTASYLSKGDYKSVKEIANFVLKIGLVTGISLSVILGLSFGSLATLFTKDAEVLGIVRTGVLFVSATQPLNALAYIFDGLHYGVSDFPYAARSMMLVGAISSVILLYAPSVIGLQGVWMGLALFMGLRTVAGFVRLLSKNGPWWFLHSDLQRTKVVGIHNS